MKSRSAFPVMGALPMVASICFIAAAMARSKGDPLIAARAKGAFGKALKTKMEAVRMVVKVMRIWFFAPYLTRTSALFGSLRSKDRDFKGPRIRAGLQSTDAARAGASGLSLQFISDSVNGNDVVGFVRIGFYFSAQIIDVTVERSFENRSVVSQQIEELCPSVHLVGGLGENA